MLFGAVVSAVSVGLGAALGSLSQGAADRWAAPIQVFALTAAVTVVAAHLLPEAISSAGPVVLLVFAAALIAPAVIDRLGNERRSGSASLETGYAGLLVHKVADGFALGAATGALMPTDHPTGVVAAIAGHTVPLTAVVFLAFEARAGSRQAWLRAGGLFPAMVAGVVLAGVIPERHVLPYEPYITAAVGGLLVHVVTHGWRPVAPRSKAQWVWIAAAGAVGIAIVLWGGH